MNFDGVLPYLSEHLKSNQTIIKLIIALNKANLFGEIGVLCASRNPLRSIVLWWCVFVYLQNEVETKSARKTHAKTKIESKWKR